MFLFKKRELVVITVGMLALLVTPNTTYGLGLGANLLTHAWWDTPGHHYVPDGQTPIHYTMEVFTYDDLYVSGHGAVQTWDGGIGMPSTWVVENVSSNLRGNLSVTGSTEERFYMEGTAGERLTFTWTVTPQAGHSWGNAYRLDGTVRAHSAPTGGFGASPAVGAWFKLRDPRRHFSKTMTVGGSGGDAKIVSNLQSWKDPQFSAPYGYKKEYHENDYTPWIDKGDLVRIDMSSATGRANVTWQPDRPSNYNVGWTDFWSGIPTQGIGHSTFYPKGGTEDNLYPHWSFPDDYEQATQYIDSPGWTYDGLPVRSWTDSSGLSIGSIVAEMVTLDGQVIPLDDGIDESGIGLYGSGYVGDGFLGPAPASGFLRVRTVCPPAQGSSNSFYLDGVQIEITPVPEPMTLCLLSFGGLAVLKRQRRR